MDYDGIFLFEEKMCFLSRCSNVCVFGESTDLKVCDVIIGITPLGMFL